MQACYNLVQIGWLKGGRAFLYWSLCFAGGVSLSALCDLTSSSSVLALASACSVEFAVILYVLPFRTVMVIVVLFSDDFMCFCFFACNVVGR